MKIKVLINRKVEKDYFNKEGTQNENNSTILNFELPKEMLDYNKRIVFITEDGNLWDYIQDTEYKIPQSITKFGCVLCYIWLTKDDIDWRSTTFDLNFYKNENADDMQPSKEELDGFNTLIDILNQKIEEVDLLVEKWDNLDVIFTELSRYESMFKDMEKILDTKVDKVDGYGLSQEDFTSILKQKLDELSIDLQQHSLKNVTYEANTGILNFIKNNEEIIQIDLPLELLIESGKYDEENKQIVLTLANLDVINIPLSDLLDDLYTKSEVDEFVAEIKKENKYQAGIIDQFKNEFQTNTVEGSKIDINDSAELPALVTPLASTEQEVIKAEEGKTVEEKNITVEDVDINKEHSISVKGSISQEIREGYNLIDISSGTLFNTTTQGVTSSRYNDEITLNGTANATTAFLDNCDFKELENGNTYTVKLIPLSGEFEAGAIGYRVMDSNGAQLFSSQAYFDSFKTTQQASISGEIAKIQVYFTSTFIGKDFKFRVLLIKGDEDKPYEKFGVSPSIKSPSPVKYVSGNYEVKVQNKNLFDKIIQDEDVGKYLNVDGLISDSENWRISKYIKLIPNTSYSISGLYGVAPTCFLYDKNKNYTRNLGEYNSIPTKEFTTTENEYYIRISVYVNVIDKLQLEKNTPTDYIPHEETVKNLDIPTGYELYGETDYYYKKLDKWYVHNEYSKVALKELDWITSNTLNDKTRYITHSLEGKILGALNNDTKVKNAKCTILSIVTAGQTYSETEGLSVSDSGFTVIFIDDLSTETDTTKFMELLQDTNAYLIYPLAEPTETEITDETFSQQLEDLYNAEIYEGVTNIDTSTEYEDMVELPNLNLHYNYVTPAPSPNKPSEYKYVEGKQTIVQSNKNLWIPEINGIPIINGNVQLNNDEYTFQATGADMYLGNVVGALGAPYLKEYGTLYDVRNFDKVSLYITNEIFNKIYYSLWDNDKKSLNKTIPPVIASNKFTVDVANANYISFRIGIGNSVAGETYKTKVQLEYGDTPTDYIPHQEQTYELDLPYKLAVIGDIFDSYEIITSGDTYKTVKNIVYHKNFDEAILSELVWKSENTTYAGKRYVSNTIKDKIKNNASAYTLLGNTYSNILTEKTPQNTWDGIEGFSSQKTLQIFITDLKYETTTDKFMQLLTDTNAKLLYPLQNTEDIILTRSENQTFFEQLDKIVNDYFTYEGINHIIVQSEQGIPMKIKLEYKQSNKLILKSMQKEIEDLKNKIV